VLGWASAANATVLFAHLNGGNEVPANASAGTGTARVDFDPLTQQMRVQIDFSGLTGLTTASHIHCCTLNPGDLTQTAGVATTTPTFPGFPLGVKNGTYDQTFDMSLAASYNPAFITANGNTVASAEAVLFAGLLAGKAYLNVHSDFAPRGEIRGFLVPEPGTIALFIAGLLGMVTIGSRRRMQQPARIS
jgi:hypothetical protein